MDLKVAGNAVFTGSQQSSYTTGDHVRFIRSHIQTI